MKILKYVICLACAMWMGTTMISAKNDKDAQPEEQTVYIFGVACAFGDSLVHFTDVQEIKGLELVNKGFLEYRSLYSYQLKNYLENAKNLPNRTCTVYFSEKKSKLEKTFAKFKKRYQGDKSVALRPLGAQEFSFTRHGGAE